MTRTATALHHYRGLNSKLHRLEENLGGADVEFSAAELDDLTTAASKLQLVGDRLPQSMLDLTGQ